MDVTRESTTRHSVDLSGCGCAAMIIAATLFCYAPALISLLRAYVEKMP
jgi:hypothetical protein